jgi:hypothetical protein
MPLLFHRSSTWLALAIAALLWASCENAVAGDRPAVPCATATCPFRLKGGALELRFEEGDIRCRSVGGQGSLQSISGRGITILAFNDCREHVTPFHFSCTDQPGSTPRVTSNRLETYVKAGSTDGQVVVFGNFRLGLRCGGFLEFAVEGYWQGQAIPRRGCQGASIVGPLAMILYAHGREGSGAFFDVFVDPQSNTYRVENPWQLVPLGASSVDIDCTRDHAPK